jgi:hypothetical protein
MGGLSTISAHRPGDAVTEPMPVPAGFDFGGEHRLVIDTTVKYLSPSNVEQAASERRPPTKSVDDAEAEPEGAGEPVPPTGDTLAVEL